MEKQLLLLFARLVRETQRCRIYAMRAEKDGRPELSLLFKALASSLEMQANRFLVQIRGSVGPTPENETTAFEKELPEFIMDYRTLLKEAKEIGAKALETGFLHSATVQQRNLDLYNLLDEQEGAAAYFVCDFCGYVATGEPPDNCPVCTAPKKRFITIEAD